MPSHHRRQIRARAASCFIAGHIGFERWLAQSSHIDDQGLVAALANLLRHEGMFLPLRVHGPQNGDGWHTVEKMGAIYFVTFCRG